MQNWDDWFGVGFGKNKVPLLVRVCMTGWQVGSSSHWIQLRNWALNVGDGSGRHVQIYLRQITEHMTGVPFFVVVFSFI